jgi:hypothetical protein
MSWTFSVGPVEREQFEDAVMSVQASGQEGVADAAEQVEIAKDVALLLAMHVKRSKLTANATGHALQETDDANWHDGISVSVSGVA